MADDAPARPAADVSPTSLRHNGNKRLEQLEELLDRMGATETRDQGQWESLGVMIVDAALTCDDATLKAAYTGLQWLFSESDVLDAPDAERLVEKGRALGMLDLTRWHLRRSVSSALPTLPRDGLAARLLQTIAQRPGSRNRDLVARLGVDETQLSRLGRQLRATALAWSRKTGRENAWFVTPRGLSCLQALGMDLDEPTFAAQAAPVAAPPAVAAAPTEPAETTRTELVPTTAVGKGTERSLPSEEYAQVLSTILAKEPEGPQQVLEQTGLPGRMVEQAIEFLVRNGYIVHARDDSGSRHLLRVNENRHRALGVSVTPTEITAVLTTLRASDVSRRRRTIDACGPEAVIPAIKDLCDELLSGDGVVRQEVIGLGVNLPGHVDSRTGVVVTSPLEGMAHGGAWSGFALADRLHRETGLPTIVENDVNALTLHEQFFGDGQQTSDFAVMYVTPNGEGVGSGLVISGSLVHGSRGVAGEIGHVPVVGNDAKCWCGNTGCLETAVNLSAIRHRILQATGTAPKTLAEAAAMVEQGNTAAAAAFRASGDALGRGIAILLDVVDPELVIISAPVELVDIDDRLRSAQLFTAAAMTSMKQHAYSDLAARSRVIRRSLVGSYAARGAASALLLRRLYESADRCPPVDEPHEHPRLVPAAVRRYQA